jgi:hypothetical protein
MASALARLELWDGLDAVSGKVRIAADLPVVGLVTTQREDGDDSASYQMPLAHPAASLVVPGTVLRQIGTDATVVEWIVTVVDEVVEEDRLSATCAAPRTWLNTSAITIVDETRTDAPSTLLSALTVQSGWPAWVTVGTVQPTTPVAIQWASETGLSALMKVVDAVDATLADGDPPCVLRFRRASDSSYVMDLLTTPPTGTAYLLEGKNIPRLARRRDATSGTSITSYTMDVVDCYRHDATAWPLDNLVPYETCRLGSASLALDATVRIAEVVTDFRDSFSAKVQLGAPRRRLIRETEGVAASASPPVPVLSVTPGTMTATTKPYTLSATIASGTVTVRVVPRGTTATGDTYGAISDGTSAAMVQGEILTVDRPAQGDPPASVVVEAFGSDGGGALVVLEIPAQDPPVLLTITATQTAADATTVTYDVVAVDPLGTASITISDDGGSATTGPSGDEWVIARPDEGDPPLAVKFTATATGRVAQSVTVTVPAQTATAGVTPPSIPVFYVSGEDLSGNTITTTHSGVNEPVGVTYDLSYRVAIVDRSTGLTDEILFGTETNITSPYNLGITGLDLVTKGTSGWRDLTYNLRLQMMDGSTVEATAETSYGNYGIYTP